jgi:signal transduction histidine kinase
MRPFISGRKQGTGLGLSIVQRILVQHGSSLRVNSRLGEGTEMSFELESV